MIVKGREISFEIHQLKALERRLHTQHKKKERVQSDLKKVTRGLRGEKEVDYPLRFLNEKNYLILHNLRLPDPEGYFQIDTLLISERFILILEVKNWYGTILFGESGQVTRIGDRNIEEGFPNPVPQAQLQQYRLRNWLNRNGTSNIPIEFLVVISFPSTIIKSISSKDPLPENVIHNSQLLFKIEKLEALYPSPKAKMHQLKRLGQLLIAAHTPPSINILERYDISTGELIKGVQCTECSTLPMIRKKQRWYCVACKQMSLNAHLAAFNDYKLLIGNKISNKKARELLQIGSPYITKHLLQKEKFNKIGQTSKRVYELEFRLL